MIVPELVGAPAAVQGSDISGTIVKVGLGVTRVRPHPPPNNQIGD
jgi:NADPH:quinone reductase-like Zn-dependent oxidoreductase